MKLLETRCASCGRVLLRHIGDTDRACLECASDQLVTLATGVSLEDDVWRLIEDISRLHLNDVAEFAPAMLLQAKLLMAAKRLRADIDA